MLYKPKRFTIFEPIMKLMKIMKIKKSMFNSE